MYPRVTAIIPAYNEESRITGPVVSAIPVVDEVIVVDDGSTDNTGRVARDLGATVITMPGNKGYIDALKKGIQAATGDVIVTLDADGEFSPHDIPLLVAPIAAGKAEMVQGHRDVVPRPSERFITWLANLKGDVGDSGTGLRAFESNLARSLDIRGACICGVLSLEVLRRGGRILDVPVSLNIVNKPRKIAWFHLKQLFYVFPWLLAKI